MKVLGQSQGDNRIGNPSNVDSAGPPSVNNGNQAPVPQHHQQQQRGPSSSNAPPARLAQNTAGPSNGNGSHAKSSAPPSNAPIFPIKSLNPYQNKWTIKARVLKKGEIKTWNNAKGSGQLFSVVLSDASGDIKATGFKEAVNLFYELLQEGSVYEISKATLKPANKQYNTTNNDYEMSFDQNTSICFVRNGVCQDESFNNSIFYSVPLTMMFLKSSTILLRSLTSPQSRQTLLLILLELSRK